MPSSRFFRCRGIPPPPAPPPQGLLAPCQRRPSPRVMHKHLSIEIRSYLTPRKHYHRKLTPYRLILESPPPPRPPLQTFLCARELLQLNTPRVVCVGLLKFVMHLKGEHQSKPNRTCTLSVSSLLTQSPSTPVSLNLIAREQNSSATLITHALRP